MFAYLGRQAIFSRERKPVGYELLYRSGTGGNVAHIADGDAATRQVLNDAVSVFGIQSLTGGLPAYVNFTRNLILSDFAYLADPKDIVVEVMGAMEFDDFLYNKLLELTRAGYLLALDDYNGSFKFEKAMPLFDIVRVDVREYNKLRQKDLVHKIRQSHIRPLAEKVETLQDFLTAREAGFDLFQGYYFEKPAFLRKEIPNLAVSTYGMLLSELLKPETDFERCSQIIESDTIMTYMFLRQVQHARYARDNLRTEIQRGLVYMGTEELRRWVSVLMLKQTNITGSEDLPRRAYLRGRFIEVLMANSSLGLDYRQGFMLGMFSLLDQVTGTRLETLAQDMVMDPAVLSAITGSAENAYSAFLQYAVIYELGNARLILPDIGIRLGDQAVMQLYMACMNETDQAFARLGNS